MGLGAHTIVKIVGPDDVARDPIILQWDSDRRKFFKSVWFKRAMSKNVPEIFLLFKANHSIK